MSFDSEKLLDSVGWELLRILQVDARLSYSELGKRVGLSAPGVADRIRKMEDAGIITGYRADVSAERVGLPITAFIRVVTPNEQHFITFLRSLREVYECHRVLGEDSCILKVRVTSVDHLEKLVDQLAVYGKTTTSLVTSSPLLRKTIEPEVD
jgi:Lrp/AsnC family leucine-responsive transcriptional regulator